VVSAGHPGLGTGPSWGQKGGRMARQHRLVFGLLVGVSIAALLSSGCNPAGPDTRGGAGARSEPAAATSHGAATKRVVAAVLGLPVALNAIVGGPNLSAPGTAELAAMLHVGLTTPDPSGLRTPRIAETAPTIENEAALHRGRHDLWRWGRDRSSAQTPARRRGQITGYVHRAAVLEPRVHRRGTVPAQGMGRREPRDCGGQPILPSWSPLS